MVAGLTRRPFGKTPDGATVEAITLTNAHGTSATIITYGAALQAFVGPDKSGVMADVVLGYPELGDYLTARNYFGATVGRVANRIADGQFALDGITYWLAQNDGNAHLHGGRAGFDCAVWHVADTTEMPSPSIRLTHTSPDGDEGYPGRLDVETSYTLDDADQLTINYAATTDRPTIVNITNHALFNAAGEGAARRGVDNILTLAATAYLPIDADFIPAGKPRSVVGTAFDFTQPHLIAERMNTQDDQLNVGQGYDHNMVLGGRSGTTPRFAARLEDPEAGRAIELFTDQPGLQFYSGNFLDATTRGKSGSLYSRGDGIALEPQHFPNAPNRPDFASVRLDPGQVYRSKSIIAFASEQATRPGLGPV